MAQISAALVKQLRDKTGAGMMDCKKALTETDGELEAAVDWLRKSGLAQAARKAGRTAAEGLIGMATAPGKAAMVEINAETDFVARNADFQAVVRELAMHIAAASPQAVSRDSLDQTMVERERGVLAEQARAEGKPENIIEKMIEGRLRKFFEEVVLLEQTWVIDGETRVKSVLESLAGTLDTSVAVSDFVRYQLGEGIERESKDFAAEVAAQLGS
ncbi:Elongation factor Ts [Geodia barretti]|uniref:Elongation factor Ts, mitochondrial n=2 Tax=Geodia barretti TaxID=519541 RepID=A0AA35RFU7_GEOBA|nr:Elongation factor Ts [Geodia barretti]